MTRHYFDLLKIHICCLPIGKLFGHSRVPVDFKALVSVLFVLNIKFWLASCGVQCWSLVRAQVYIQSDLIDVSIRPSLLSHTSPDRIFLSRLSSRTFLAILQLKLSHTENQVNYLLHAKV